MSKPLPNHRAELRPTGSITVTELPEDPDPAARPYTAAPWPSPHSTHDDAYTRAAGNARRLALAAMSDFIRRHSHAPPETLRLLKELHSIAARELAPLAPFDFFEDGLGI